jgi:hypothetical protein
MMRFTASSVELELMDDFSSCMPPGPSSMITLYHMHFPEDPLTALLTNPRAIDSRQEGESRVVP